MKNALVNLWHLFCQCLSLCPFQVVNEDAHFKRKVFGSPIGWLKTGADEILSDAFNIISKMEVN